MINYNLMPFERAFAFQITSQNTKVDDFMKSTGTFISSNGWKIKVAKMPEVNVFSKTIYLQGSNSLRDLRIDRTWNLPSNSFRDTVISEVSNAITELISSVKAFNTFRPYELVRRNDYYPYTSFVYFTSEVKDKWNGKFDSEGWGPNKLDPSKATIVLN